ncbi:MAG: helix-turn-helix domain-containing protein [Rhizobiaceae bacterium]|nr:helix-turn-helix domain-containing protein [Rhizobiaceae bacterium]MCV0405555.1 helix-turn-helix domain-containing protein [Rhizobiaceae bacterium]
MKKKANEDHADPLGGTLEELLEQTGEREEVYAEALKRVLAWQIEQARRQQDLSKSDVATRMGTSRSQLERILDPTNAAVSLQALDKAARAVGKRLSIEIVDA